MALLNNGTVQAWGNATWLQTSVPSSLTGVAMLSGHYYHCLALRTNGTIVGWGRYDYGQDRAPTWLTNAMAVSTGEEHSLALVPDPPPPTIHVSSSSANLILSWTTLDSYALESATNILGPFFTDAAVLTTNNSTINATIPAVEPARFFRLRKP
jgi:hypothetical protein